ncbi:MAG: hypothetical protein IIA66_13225 [Planctomycetes bacterium]|nr:hypothetical protein [Planctomycetota bacterium]
MTTTDVVNELQQIRIERDEAVRERDALRQQAFELTKRIFELNVHEEQISPH